MRWLDAEDTDMKNTLKNFAVLLLLFLALGVWTALPWQGVLAVAVLVALWLALSRGGRLALAAAQ